MLSTLNKVDTTKKNSRKIPWNLTTAVIKKVVDVILLFLLSLLFAVS